MYLQSCKKNPLVQSLHVVKFLNSIQFSIFGIDLHFLLKEEKNDPDLQLSYLQ